MLVFEKKKRVYIIQAKEDYRAALTKLLIGAAKVLDVGFPLDARAQPGKILYTL